MITNNSCETTMKVIVISILSLSLTSLKVGAQEKKYLIWGTYVVAPSYTSYQMLYRVDSFFERYEMVLLKAMELDFQFRFLKDSAQ